MSRKLKEYLDKLENITVETEKDCVLKWVERGHRSTLRYIERKGGIDNLTDKDYQILARRVGFKHEIYETKVDTLFYCFTDAYEAQFHDGEDKLGRDFLMEAMTGDGEPTKVDEDWIDEKEIEIFKKACQEKKRINRCKELGLPEDSNVETWGI